MPLSTTAYRACNFYTYFTLVVFVVMGSVCIHCGNNVKEVTAKSSPTQLQIVPDWRATPYTSIYIASGANNADISCREGSEPIYDRVYGGTDLACDCTNSCDVQGDLSKCYTLIKGDYCNTT